MEPLPATSTERTDRGQPPTALPTEPQAATIRAKDIMTSDVVSVAPEATVHDVARLLKTRNISAVPVLDHGAVVGIVSEGDLIHREELGTATVSLPTERTPTAGELSGSDKVHGARARDVMTRKVIAVTEATPLPDIVKALDINHIRRVVVLRDNKLVGIVSRANIVHALAGRPTGSTAPTSHDDDVIRLKVVEALLGIPGTSPWLTRINVANGVVRLDGIIEEEVARDPSQRAIERIPNVVAVEDHRATLQPY